MPRCEGGDVFHEIEAAYLGADKPKFIDIVASNFVSE